MPETYEIGTQEIIPHWHPWNMMLKVLRNMRTATTRYYYLDLVIDNAIYIIMMCKMGGRNHLNPACILTSSFHVYKLFCEIIWYKIKLKMPQRHWHKPVPLRIMIHEVVIKSEIFSYFEYITLICSKITYSFIKINCLEMKCMQ